MPPSRPEQRHSHGGSTDGSAEENPRAAVEEIPTSTSRSSRKEDNKSTASGALKFPEAYNEIQNLNEIPMWLAPCNFVAAIFQLLQACFIFAFSARVNLNWCVYTFYPNAENDVYETAIYAVPGQELVGCYTVTWLTGIVVLTAGINHLLAILPYFREKYEYHIERHQSPQRWIEYSISCPLMRVIIAQVAGVTDIYTLVLSFFLGQACIIFGLLHERLNAKNRADGYVQDYSAFWASCLSHMASWGVVFAYFVEGMAEVDNNLALGLVLTLFILELTFPLVFVLQWRKIGPFQDFLVGEFTFCLLSFTAKTFLAWTTLIGAHALARQG
jgi:Heliorhodopsin